mmetsp:Transcript_38451/g.106104  ORF Transcript_38451/g.106104 Transcript_38451/m.106104 type:complete len:299 (-) Transcript_38451:382-1278(-)
MMYTSSTSVGQRTKPTCNAAAALTRAATRHQSAPHSTTQHHKAPHTQHDTRLERRHATRTDGRERGVPARDPPPPQDSPRAHTAQHASHAAPPTALYWGGHGAHIVSKMPRGGTRTHPRAWFVSSYGARPSDGVRGQTMWRPRGHARPRGARHAALGALARETCTCPARPRRPRAVSAAADASPALARRIVLLLLLLALELGLLLHLLLDLLGGLHLARRRQRSVAPVDHRILPFFGQRLLHARLDVVGGEAREAAEEAVHDHLRVVVLDRHRRPALRVRLCSLILFESERDRRRRLV